MSSFNPKHQDDLLDDIDQMPEYLRPKQIVWRSLGAESWIKLSALTLLELGGTFAWAASFSSINQIASDIFIADFIPVPEFMENMTAGSLINLFLGGMAVIIPIICWHYAISTDAAKHPKKYFSDQPVRIVVAVMLATAYAMTITLEVMSLLGRIDDTVNHGPIPILGEQPEILPLSIASFALVVGTCLLGLASASLHHALNTRFSA